METMEKCQNKQRKILIYVVFPNLIMYMNDHLFHYYIWDKNIVLLWMAYTFSNANQRTLSVPTFHADRWGSPEWEQATFDVICDSISFFSRNYTLISNVSFNPKWTEYWESASEKLIHRETNEMILHRSRWGYIHAQYHSQQLKVIIIIHICTLKICERGEQENSREYGAIWHRTLICPAFTFIVWCSRSHTNERNIVSSYKVLYMKQRHWKIIGFLSWHRSFSTCFISFHSSNVYWLAARPCCCMHVQLPLRYFVNIFVLIVCDMDDMACYSHNARFICILVVFFFFSFDLLLHTSIDECDRNSLIWVNQMEDWEVWIGYCIMWIWFLVMSGKLLLTIDAGMNDWLFCHSGGSFYRASKI